MYQMPDYFRRDLKKTYIESIAYASSQAIIFFGYAAIFTLGAYLIENERLEYDDMYRLVYTTL